MKFAEHLSSHITPEWRKQYLQYEAFKDMLYAAQDQAPSIEASSNASIAPCLNGQIAMALVSNGVLLRAFGRRACRAERGPMNHRLPPRCGRRLHP
ncbi:unnamed protein product [Arctogadus glacialis]